MKEFKERYYLLITRYADWLVPVLALVVIFQSVLLATVGPGWVVQRVRQVVPVATPTPTPVKPVAVIKFIPTTIEVQKGKSFKVEVGLTPLNKVELGGLDLVFAFDPKQVTVNKVEPDKVFSLIVPNRQSEKSGRLYITFLDENGEGVVVDKETRLVTLTMTARQTGLTEVSLLTGEVGARTVITEQSTSRSLPTTIENLSVTVK